MTIFKSLRLRNLYWLFSDKLIRIPITLLISSLMARYLGPSDLGTIVFAISFFGIFGFLINFGVEEIVTRNLIDDPDNIKSILNVGFFLKFLGGMFAFLISIISAFFLVDFKEFLLVVIVSLSGLFCGPLILESYFLSRYESKYIVRVGLIVFLISSFVKLIGIFLGFGIVFFTILTPIEVLMISASYVYLGINRKVPFFGIKLNFDYIKNISKDSFPLIISGFAVTFYMKMDQMMIKTMLGNSDLGIFSVGIKFVENLYFVPMLITSGFLPMLVEEKSKSIKELNRATYLLTSSTFYICFAIAVIFFFLAEELIYFFFGLEYHDAIPIFKVYSFTLIFTALGVSASRRLLVENRQNLSLYRTLSGLLLNLILNLLWIPKYGSIGASWASVISNLFASFLFYGLVPSTWEIFRLQCISFNPLPMIKHFRKL